MPIFHMASRGPSSKPLTPTRIISCKRRNSARQEKHSRATVMANSEASSSSEMSSSFLVQAHHRTLKGYILTLPVLYVCKHISQELTSKGTCSGWHWLSVVSIGCRCLHNR